MTACKQVQTNDVFVGTVAAYDVSTFYSLFPFRKSRQMEYWSVQTAISPGQECPGGAMLEVGSDISQDQILTIPAS